MRAKARSPSVGIGPSDRAVAIEPVTSLSPIMAKLESMRLRLQPPTPTPIRTNVMTAPAGEIANRPTRPHVLYRVGLYWGGNALWTAGGRNSDLLT